MQIKCIMNISIGHNLQPTEHYFQLSMFLYSHTHSLVVYISQYNDCGLMISEYNYKMYLLMYSRVILYVIFFRYLQIMCALTLIKNAFVYRCVVGTRGSHNLASTLNVFVISVMSYHI